MRRWKSFKFQNISKETWCTRVKSHQNHTKHSGAQTKPFFYIKYRNYSMKSLGALKHFLVWFLFQDTLVYFDRRGRSFSWWLKEQLLSYSLTFQRTLVSRQSKEIIFLQILYFLPWPWLLLFIFLSKLEYLISVNIVFDFVPCDLFDFGSCF